MHSNPPAPDSLLNSEPVSSPMNQNHTPSIMPQKRHTAIKRTIVAAGVCLAALAIPSTSSALQLTFQMRVNPVGTTAGVVIAPDFRSATANNPGDVIAFQLYAIVNGQNGTHADDGVLSAQGSFVSGNGGLTGTVRADPPGTVNATATQTNNAGTQFTGGIATSGIQLDLDGDGDLDAGSLATTQAPTNNPWFTAVGNGNTYVLGTGATPGSTEFLIGSTTFTLSANPVVGQSATVSFAPRNWLTGGIGSKATQKIKLDNVNVDLLGNSLEITTTGATVLYQVPEPSAVAMLMLGTVGLIGLRRKGLARR